jgi:G2/mitotic-specific cyclin-B, other
MSPAKKMTKNLKPSRASEMPVATLPDKLSRFTNIDMVTNIDIVDRKDPLAVTQYVQDIYQELRIREIKLSPTPGYLTLQPDLNDMMVSIMIDWLVQLQGANHGPRSSSLDDVSMDALYLAANIIHRFLSKSDTDIKRSEFQLVGVTAYFIAAKYEDLYPPFLSDLVYICDNSCSQHDILSMEVRILKTLNYRVSAPTARNFLSRYLKAAKAHETVTHVANYILDGTLLNYNLLEFRPSQLAAASVLIANSKSEGRPLWSSTLEHYTGYSESEVISVAKSVLEEKANTFNNVQSVHEKYSKILHGKVSIIYIFDPTSLTV